MSILALAKTIPVKPPIVKRIINPITQRVATEEGLKEP
jgi:hypothetical protein